MEFLDDFVFFIKFVFEELLYLGVIPEPLLMFLLLYLGFSLDHLVELLYFGQLSCQYLMLGLYQTVE